MKIIYCCYGGAHSSVVAASIHMGYLPKDRIPTIEEIVFIPYYDKSPKESIGTPLHMGVDDNSNHIYLMGMGPYRKEYIELTYNLAVDVFNENKENIKLINVTSLLNLRLRVGGFLSRRLNLIKIGRPLTARGIQKNYFKFVNLVNNVKEDVNKRS